MVGVFGEAWRSGRRCLEGYAELQMTVYWEQRGYAWQYWGLYWGSIRETRRYWGAVQWERYGDAWRYWDVPLTPLTTQGECRGIPWPREQTRGTVPRGMYIV